MQTGVLNGTAYCLNPDETLSAAHAGPGAATKHTNEAELLTQKAEALAMQLLQLLKPRDVRLFMSRMSDKLAVGMMNVLNQLPGGTSATAALLSCLNPVQAAR